MFVVAAVVVMGLVVVVGVVVCEDGNVVVVEGMVAGTEQAHESSTL